VRLKRDALRDGIAGIDPDLEEEDTLVVLTAALLDHRMAARLTHGSGWEHHRFSVWRREPSSEMVRYRRIPTPMARDM
jgi:hypothetical protein